MEDADMPDKNDKDGIIKFLLETIDKVDSELDGLNYHRYYCDGCYDTSVKSVEFYDKINEIRDYIWHRKTDVTF